MASNRSGRLNNTLNGTLSNTLRSNNGWPAAGSPTCRCHHCGCATNSNASPLGRSYGGGRVMSPLGRTVDSLGMTRQSLNMTRMSVASRARAAGVEIPKKPMGLIEGEDGIDYVPIVPRKLGFMVLLLMACVLAASACAYCILYPSFEVGGVVASFAIFALIFGYFTTQVRAEFHHDTKEFIFVRRRLLTEFCGRKEEIAACPFSSVGEPYIKSDVTEVRKKQGSLDCHVFLPVEGAPNGRIPVVIRNFSDTKEKDAALLGWQKYINDIRGVVEDDIPMGYVIGSPT
jgi:hypothetical protein